ncbi:alanyl-tRNA editing protein [Enterobacteriaceae bacterium]
MTERRYYTSDALQGDAQLLRCAVNEEGLYEVELDATLFHPQGGGQPSDQGTLNGVPVVRVENRGETVCHILVQPIAGERVTMLIDADCRQRHARWHSAGHLIGYAGEQSGWRPVKAHHWPGEGRITFVAHRSDTLPTPEELSALIAGWIADGLERHVAVDGEVREVRFGDLPAYRCGGTHVSSLADLPEVVLTQIKLKKGQLVVNYALDA